MKLSPQLIAIVALVAIGLLVGAAGYLMVVSPQHSKAGKIAEQIDTVQTELMVAEGASARPVPFHASDLFRFANAMPGTTDMPGILLGLRQVADKSKVKLTSVRPSPPVAQALGYSAVPLAVTVTGNYRAITKFLGLLHRDVRLVGAKVRVGGRMFDADTVSIQPGQVGDQLNAALSLAAFIYTGQVLTPTPPAGSTTTTTTTASAG
jgi:Tfp pilus assembly protein PilO